MPERKIELFLKVLCGAYVFPSHRGVDFPEGTGEGQPV